MHAERLRGVGLGYACIPSLVLTTQAVFRLERGHTDTSTHTVTDATDHPVPRIGYVGVG